MARSAGESRTGRRAVSVPRRGRLTPPVCPQARGGRPAGQLGRQQLRAQPWGRLPLPDREQSPREVRAAPAR